jgi:hypothetical protein
VPFPRLIIPTSKPLNDECLAVEFEHFIKEQDAFMSQADLAGP